MDADIAALVREAHDRREIYECIMRYCRGVDRFDRAIARSAYHDDAIDDHGGFVGPVEPLIDYAFGLHAQYHRRTQHMIGNHSCEIDGDTAHCESYYLCRTLNREAPWHSSFSGRYIDRFEKRAGRWGIVARICTVEVRDDASDPEGMDSQAPYYGATRDKDDPYYIRPLVIDPARFTV